MTRKATSMEVDVTVSVLDTTVSVRWRGALAGTVPDGRRHWRTKVAYYQAVDELLATGETGPLAWQPIVDAVRPRGSRSTFYEVAGRHAKYPLVGALIQDGGMEAIQVALCYQRGSAVEQLIDEAKVWHYWRYRDRLVTRCRAERELSRPALAE
ncbi:MAG TPA: hypothetical protein VJT31_35340, partial [Rugosimonospora sp.]|nr:hypothetical protein [Rugosimonospora sp.]